MNPCYWFFFRVHEVYRPLHRRSISTWRFAIRLTECFVFKTMFFDVRDSLMTRISTTKRKKKRKHLLPNKQTTHRFAAYNLPKCIDTEKCQYRTRWRWSSVGIVTSSTLAVCSQQSDARVGVCTCEARQDAARWRAHVTLSKMPNVSRRRVALNGGWVVARWLGVVWGSRAERNTTITVARQSERHARHDVFPLVCRTAAVSKELYYNSIV